MGRDDCGSCQVWENRWKDQVFLRTGEFPRLKTISSNANEDKCWLCIPALIYQTAVPIFQRTRRFANPYAFAVVDVLFTILWFAAFVAVATWTNGGIRAGEAENEDKKLRGCAAFAFGPESKCTLSKATIGMGVIILYVLHSQLISINSRHRYSSSH